MKSFKNPVPAVPAVQAVPLKYLKVEMKFVNIFYTFSKTAIHCNTLRHTATHCHTLQHTATHCNTLRPCLTCTRHIFQRPHRC